MDTHGQFVCVCCRNTESEALFSDIDGMLLGLTAELDEMLKLQGWLNFRRSRLTEPQFVEALFPDVSRSYSQSSGAEPTVHLICSKYQRQGGPMLWAEPLRVD